MSLIVSCIFFLVDLLTYSSYVYISRFADTVPTLETIGVDLAGCHGPLLGALEPAEDNDQDTISRIDVF